MRVRGSWCVRGGEGSCLLFVRPGRLGIWSGRPADGQWERWRGWCGRAYWHDECVSVGGFVVIRA